MVLNSFEPWFEVVHLVGSAWKSSDSKIKGSNFDTMLWFEFSEFMANLEMQFVSSQVRRIKCFKCESNGSNPFQKQCLGF